MPDRIVRVDGVEHHFPADATDAEISSALNGTGASAEPDTYAGGFIKGLKDYGADVATRAGGAFAHSFNIPALMAEKQAGDTQDATEMQQMVASGHGTPRQPWTVGTLKRAAQNTVDQAPELAGGLAGAYVTGKLVNLAGKGMETLAPKVMDTGLWRSGAQRMDFPNTPQRLIDEGIVPTTEQVQKALTQTEGQVNAQAAQQSGPWSRRVLPSKMADQAADFATTEGKVPGLGDTPGPEAMDVARAKAGYLSQNTRARDLPETIAQKRSYQARTSYNPRPNAPVQTNESVNFNKGIAAANRAAAIRMDPSLEGLLSKEQDLMGADQALAYTNARSTPTTMTGIMRHAVMHPAPMGSAAISLDRIGGALSNPALLKAALLAKLLGQSEEPQP